jgi:hypothetical protein
MELDSLRRGRRILSAAVSLVAIALVMARLRGADHGAGDAVGSVAVVAFVLMLALLVVVWRKEYVASEVAFAARAEQRFAFLKLEIELAKKKSGQAQSAATGQRTKRTRH